MWIKKLTLSNIRSFPHAEIKFSAGINIIVGQNNSGKSTIIRSIDRLQGLNWNGEGLLRNSRMVGLVECELEAHSDDLIVSNGINFKVDKEKLFYILDQSQTHYGVAPNSLKLPKIESLRSIPLDKNKRPEIKSTRLFQAFPDEEPNNLIYASYSRRNWYESQISEESSVKIRQDHGNLTSRIHKLEGTPRGKKFKEACRAILGFEPKALTLNRSQGSNHFSIGIYTDDTQKIFLNHMGQGVSQILSLLSIIFTQKHRIILLEEIENDLHPGALKKLLELIIDKSNDNQFIISTHSNIVLTYLASKSNTRIFKTSYVLNESDELVLPHSKICEISSKPRERLEVLEEMGYETTDLDLWSGYLLLEESTSELIIKNFLIPMFFPKLTTRLATIAARGVNDVPRKFYSLQNLFVYVHLSPIYERRAWCMIDGDAAGKEVEQELIANFKSWPKEHFISLQKDNFEYYYPSRFKTKVDKVLSMPKGDHKQKAKVSLREEVLEWALKDPEEGKKQFQKSAKEILDHLKRIQKKLVKSS